MRPENLLKPFIHKFFLTSITITVLLFSFAVITIAEDLPVDTKVEKKEIKANAKKMNHEVPLPGELCVGCHMESDVPDPESITPKINNKHEVCNRCHKEDGTTEGHCGCADVSDPMDCEQCHTSPAMGDNPSAEEMNALCTECH